MSVEMPSTTGARSMITGTPSSIARLVGEEGRPGPDASRQVLGPEGGRDPVLPEHGAASDPGEGLVEDLGDVVGGLRIGDAQTHVDLAHADLELVFDLLGDVVGQALDLAEAVEFRGRVRKGAAGHVCFFPSRCSMQ